MRLVETVTRERLHEIENVVGLAGVDPALRGAGEEHRTLLGHLLRLLLAHRAAQQIGTAERIAGEDLGDLHDLLLVEDDAIGRLERAFQAWMQIVDDLSLRMLAVDELLRHAHGARPEQRDHSRQVIEPIRLQALDEIAHAHGLELEHGRRPALLYELEGFGIVDGDSVHVDRRLAAHRALGVDRRYGLVDDREGFQPKKIELDQPDRL